MSYIRAGWPLVYVEAFSTDYVYPTEEDGVVAIEDYGRISDNGFIELLYCYWDIDSPLKEHLIKRLAERLGVKLRKKPLTFDERLSMMEKAMEREKQLFVSMFKKEEKK